MSENKHHTPKGRDLRDAPEEFRKRLQRLKDKGVLDDPEFFKAVVRAFEKTRKDLESPMGFIARAKADQN